MAVREAAEGGGAFGELTPADDGGVLAVGEAVAGEPGVVAGQVAGGNRQSPLGTMKTRSLPF